MLASNQNGAQLFTTGRGLVCPHSAGRSFANPWQRACQRFLSLPVLQRRISHPLQPLRRKFPSKTTRLPAWAFPGANNSTLTGAEEENQRLSLWCTRRHLGLFCSQAYSRTPTESFLFVFGDLEEEGTGCSKTLFWTANSCMLWVSFCLLFPFTGLLVQGPYIQSFVGLTYKLTIFICQIYPLTGTLAQSNPYNHHLVCSDVALESHIKPSDATVFMDTLHWVTS